MHQGLYLRFAAKSPGAANARVHALAGHLLSHPLPGIAGLIPGIDTLYIEFDSKRLPAGRLRAHLECHASEVAAARREEPRVVEIPVRYDGEDLAEVAGLTGLTVEEVIARHSSPTYTVYLVGFSPGQPYLGDVDPRLRVPRRPSPRVRVPPSSLVIANSLTTIGPFAQPTGWSVLGRALVRLYDPRRAHPALLEPGDRVRFTPSQGPLPPEPEHLELLPPEPRHPFLAVYEAGLLDLVVDSARPRPEHFGLARGGPIDPRSARIANALVGNPPGTPLLELNITGPVLEALRSGVAAFAGWGMAPLLNGAEVETFESFHLREGDILSFRPTTRGVRGYLALAGGIESDRFLGSASVSLRGRIGRPLVAGDLLGLDTLRAARSGFGFRPRTGYTSQEPVVLRVVPGPQASAESLEALAAGCFTVTSADRVGVRFDGPEVPGGEVVSEAVPVGAVQVPPAGAPILLLNDRGTTGGYAKPVILHPGDLPLAAQLRPGTRVRFTLVRPRKPLYLWIEWT